MNYKIIRYTVGWVLNFEAACMVLPLICAGIYGEREFGVFALCAAVCVICGALLTAVKPENKAMYSKEGYVIVALSWLVISLFGSFPFVISGTIPNFVNALFETVSGFTTTGASILPEVESLPRSILFWRSFTHWIGGMGVLVFLVAILPLSGGNNLYLIKAESPGPSVSKLVPKVKSTAKILYGIYILFTLLEIIFLLAGGMNLFDSLTTSFGTAGTGGLGIRNDSVASFSPYCQWVVTVFMFLFGIDFSIYYLLFVKHIFGVLRSDEFKAYIGIVVSAIALLCLSCHGYFGSFSELLRHTAFQTASLISTTGYGTTDFDMWPEFAKTILLMLMLSGACAGSTGGGIKVSRIVILCKSIVKEIKIAAMPKSTHKITMNGKTVEHETVRAINVFMMAYLAILLVSLLIISIDGHSFTTNFTAVIASLNNIGPGFADVGPTKNFGFYSPLSKLILIFDMLAGRLEIFPMLVLFSPYTWRK